MVALTTLDSTICDRKKSLTNWADDSRKNWLCAAYTPTQTRDRGSAIPNSASPALSAWIAKTYGNNVIMTHA